MNGDGLLFLKALVKLLALQHLRHGKLGCQPDKVLSRHFGKPSRVEINHGLLRIKDFEDLRLISFGVAIDIGARERRTRHRPSRGIADHPREVSNQENYGMAEVLKMLELADEYSMPHVQVRRRGIKARLHPHRLAGLERLLQA